MPIEYINWTIVGAFILSFLIQLIVIKLSHKHSFFIDSHTNDKPQNFHNIATPRAGGIGILMGMIFVLFTPLGWKLLFSIFLAFLSGIFEDFHHSLSPRFRLFLQFVAALSAVLLTKSVITYLGLGIHIPYFLGIIFSIFAIVGLMNAINIIDGFNGLASGIVLLILFSFGMVAYQVGHDNIFFITMITISALLAFFIINFPKGYIFLGDGGAYMLGFIVALIGIFLASTYEEISPWYILAVVIYPVWEVLFSIYRRKKDNLSPFQPDGKHLHTLVFKHLAHNNNPLTSFLMLIFVAPFSLIPAYFSHSSIGNMLSIIIFIFCYTLLYKYLAKK